MVEKLSNKMNKLDIKSDDTLVEQMKEALYACPGALKYLRDLGMSDEVMEENITKIYDFVRDVIYCRKCPGIKKCKKDNAYLNTKITYNYGVVDTQLIPCKEILKRVSFERQFLVRDFPDEWLDLVMGDIDKSKPKSEAGNIYMSYLRNEDTSWIYLTGGIGSGKSYLTFAVQHFFERVKNIPCQITGVDLKEDVVKNCSDLARRLDIKNLDFVCGDIAAYKGINPDIVITLHACDTATDYALHYAIQKKAKAILSVPCCQKEINLQLKKDSNKDLAPLLKFGILRERFSALVTDAVRAELLEERGYSVQLLEFIDMEGTPKNLMIRATLKEKDATCAAPPSSKLLDAFGVQQKLFDLLNH